MHSAMYDAAQHGRSGRELPLPPDVEGFPIAEPRKPRNVRQSPELAKLRIRHDPGYPF